jgi:signal transduction histidine kinase
MPTGDTSRALPARQFLVAVGVAIILGVAPPSIEGRALLAQAPAAKHVLLLYSHESALYTYNVVKHSGASTATVRLIPTRSGVRLHIADRGRGFDDRLRSGDGLGLLSMRERVVFAGGTIAIRSAAARGTHIVFNLPVSAAASDRLPHREQARSA